MKKNIIAVMTGAVFSTAVAFSSFAVPAFAANAITGSQAQQIAYTHAGVAAKDVSYPYVVQGHEDGRSVYEVKFRSGYLKYDYDIDIYTGQIVDFDVDNLLFDD